MMAKLIIPRDLISEEDRFWWRWNRIWYVEEDNEHVDTPCWIVDRDASECGIKLVPSQNGDKRPAYWSRTINGERGTVYLARAVLKYFNEADITLFKSDTVPPVDCGHLCDNPLCINPEHLVVQTRDENMQQMALRGNQRHQKLTPDDVHEIRRLLKRGKLTQKEIGKRFGVSRGCIKNINLGNDWVHLQEEEN